MSPKTIQKTKWALASIYLDDVYTDFILLRQAMLCKPSTLRWYGFTAGRFISWLKDNGVNEPGEIAARHVRSYLAEVDSKGFDDSTIHSHARSIKPLVRFLHKKKNISAQTSFDRPPISTRDSFYFSPLKHYSRSSKPVGRSETKPPFSC